MLHDIHHIKRAFIFCMTLLTTVACTYDYEIPDSETEPMVVIFGQIVSESECVFSLHSTARPTGELEEIYSNIDDATVVVKGTDGQVFEGHGVGNFTGRFIVNVGKLSSDQKYYVEVSTPYGNFASEPMQPLDAPELTDICYEQSEVNKSINVMVTTADPHSLVYLLWQVDDYYEIYTPLTTQWKYCMGQNEGDSDGQNGTFEKISPEAYTNHGWRHAIALANFATNEDYGCGAITKRSIYTRTISDHRLQTRCCTRIKQMAITRQEYEYRRLMLNQTYNMGGLFTPMPSELPTNIKSVGERKAIGYIGVRGRTSMKEMYINGSDVGYKSQNNPQTFPQDGLSPSALVNRGYSVYTHTPDTGDTMWTFTWCVDYRDKYWGGDAIDRPDFWQNKQ